MSQNKLVKNITFLSIVQVANNVFPLITVPIISRIIGPEKYGILNYALTFVSYFVILITYGFDLTATRRLAKNPTNEQLRSEIFSEVFTAKQFLFFVSVIAFTFCIFYFPPLEQNKKVAVLTFLMCLGPLFTQNWIFQAMQNLPTVAVLNFIGRLLGALSVLLLIHNKEDFYWQAFSTSFSSVVVAICSFFWSIKTYNLHYKKVSLKRMFSLLNEEKTVFFSIVLITLYTYTNTVMLGTMKTSVDVGFYTASQRLIVVLSGVVNYPIYQAFFPFVGASFGISKENGISVLQKTSPIVLVLLFFISVFLFVSAPLIINIFYGDNFYPSILVFRILSFIPLVTGISGILGIQTMLNLNMDKQYLYISLGGACLGLVLNYFMILNYGYIGTALNWIIVECYISFSMFLYLYTKKIFPITFDQFQLSLIMDRIKSFKKQK